jgi:hypothetical protein
VELCPVVSKSVSLENAAVSGFEIALTIFFVSLFFVRIIHRAYVWRLERRLLRSIAESRKTARTDADDEAT